MKHLKSFILFESGPEIDFEDQLDQDLEKDFEEYESNVVNGIMFKMRQILGSISKRVVGPNAYEYFLDLITGHENIYGEYVMNYPDHFDQSIGDLYEEKKSVTDAINTLLDGCLALYYGHAKAL